MSYCNAYVSQIDNILRIEVVLVATYLASIGTTANA